MMNAYMPPNGENTVVSNYSDVLVTLGNTPLQRSQAESANLKESGMVNLLDNPWGGSRCEPNLSSFK